MQFSTTTLTLFLTALASPLSTTQAHIGQTHFTDNRMMVEANGCPGRPVLYPNTCPAGQIRCWDEDIGDYCYPPHIEEEECNQICRDYCIMEIPLSIMSLEVCMTKWNGGCMYPEGLDLPTPCKDNADD